MRYVLPAISCLKNHQSLSAFAQSGDFFLTFTNEQNGCCGDGDCGPPNNVPLPASINVNNGIITITLLGQSPNSCIFQGNIDEHGSFVILADTHDIDERCGFNDDRCSDAGPEPNQCCGRVGQEIVTGTYRNGHLEGSYLNDESIDENDSDCTVEDDCGESSDFTGDFI